jgi:tetratricopeptide (TPR) repeat protein
MVKQLALHKTPKLQMIVTVSLTIVWLFLISFALIAAQDPPWLRKLADLGRSGESLSVRNYGDDFLRQGNFAAAIAVYRKALDINPKDPLTMTNMAVALYRSGRSDEGLKLLNQALKIASERQGVVYFNLGEILYERGQKEEAIDCYLKSVDSEGDQDLPYLRIGKTYKEIGQLDKAREAFEKALEIQLDPCTPYRKMIIVSLALLDKDPQATSTLNSMFARGVTENDLNEYDIDFLKRINLENKNLISTYHELANICIAQGDTDSAEIYSERADNLEALTKSAASSKVSLSGR